MEGTTTTLSIAIYLLRYTPEEKRQLERKVRLAAAMGKSPLGLAEAIRIGALTCLDELIQKLRVESDRHRGADWLV
jgi:hypothetical protein